MQRKLLILSAIYGLFAVILGAFGAHALKSILSTSALENWKTAVFYQLSHALVLLFLSSRPAQKQIKIASWCFGLGILLFSGSLYLLSLREVLQVPLTFLGPVTPFGGLLLISGWFILLLSAFKRD